MIQTLGADPVSTNTSVRELRAAGAAAAVAGGSPHLGGHNEAGQGFGGRVIKQRCGRQCQPGLCADQRCHLRQCRHTARNHFRILGYSLSLL